MSKIRDKILELVEEGLVDQKQLIRDLVVWLSEDECEQFAKFADLPVDEQDEEHEDDDIPRPHHVRHV